MMSQENMSLLLILVIVFSFSFGVATMDMDGNGNMSDCLFINTITICPMSFFEHIAVFQSNFRAISFKTLLLTLLVLALFLILNSKTIPLDQQPRIKLKLFSKNYPKSPIFNKLLLALSDGIIQPKLYT